VELLLSSSKLTAVAVLCTSFRGLARVGSCMTTCSLLTTACALHVASKCKQAPQQPCNQIVQLLLLSNYR